ncbi:uncharacterized protein LOC123527316 [Mercenaria mercenaria]|uniref:uncharacterized protein LOC123527316 n=1 Tax=Mercenaria mercenaria TaxID=6596 RepID=UPI00234F7AC7|nr:uncharacterized protein LOC123527316 [Mercenaria mercenaria]
MITEDNWKDLEVKGFTVVPNVLTAEECDIAIADYRTWLSGFGENFPNTYNSIIWGYNVGHMDVTWRLRLKVKPVFSQIWKTDKLLTSFDAVAIGRPPEDGVERFDDPKQHWLHADCTPSRIGLHAYQGALYLEEQEEDDWTFQVMEGSHRKLEEMFAKFPDSAERARRCGCHFDLSEQDVAYFKSLGCDVVRVPVPKGGLALWDSRLVHANARPLKNRRNSCRWRFVTFISMTPAIWANEEDIRKHQEMFKMQTLSTHWSSQGIKYADVSLDNKSSPSKPVPATLPEIARTEEVMELSAMLPYNYSDGKPNGDDFKPVWRRSASISLTEEEDLEKKYANGHI